MDEVPFITASRFSRQKIVTVSSDKVDLTPPYIKKHSLNLLAKVTMVGISSLKVKVEIHIEQMYREDRELAVIIEFTIVAIISRQKPLFLNKMRL